MAIVPLSGGLLVPSMVGGQLGVAAPTYMGRLTAEGQALQDLLPPGLAWTRDRWAVLTRLLDALSMEFTRVNSKLASVQKEFLPASATELLPEWAALVGWTAPLPEDIVQSRKVIVRKFVATAQHSLPFWTALAADLGYAITIHEYQAFVAGSPCGDPLSQEPWCWVWEVTTASGSQNALLEATFRALAQEHTAIRFFYSV
jgi:uncharacterized protein YmfQ (DUF2313 family)